MSASQQTELAPQVTSGKTALALADTIARLRQIAAESGDHLLLSDGPPHPDHVLLGLAAETLHCMKRLEAIWDEYRKRPWDHQPCGYQVTEEDRRLLRKHEAAVSAEMAPIEGRLRSLFSQVRKARATTGAGIYAKALICRHSETGAAKLAMSLAEDLVASPHLRMTLWHEGPMQ